MLDTDDYVAHSVSMDLQVQSYAGMLHEYF